MNWNLARSAMPLCLLLSFPLLVSKGRQRFNNGVISSPNVGYRTIQNLGHVLKKKLPISILVRVFEKVRADLKVPHRLNCEGDLCREPDVNRRPPGQVNLPLGQHLQVIGPRHEISSFRCIFSQQLFNSPRCASGVSHRVVISKTVQPDLGRQEIPSKSEREYGIGFAADQCTLDRRRKHGCKNGGDCPNGSPCVPVDRARVAQRPTANERPSEKFTHTPSLLEPILP